MLGRFVGSATRMHSSRSFSSGLSASGSGVMSTFMIRAIMTCTPFLPFASSGSPNGKVPAQRVNTASIKLCSAYISAVNLLSAQSQI